MATAAVLLAVATGLGAYASHGLDSVLDARSLDTFETAVQYQFIHSLGVLIVAVFMHMRESTKLLSLAATVLLAGIVLFCGGVYASSLDGPRWIAALAPAGGLGLIVGWLVVPVAVLRR